MADINGGDDDTYTLPEPVEKPDTDASDAEIADLKAKIEVLENLKADQAKKIAALESEAAGAEERRAELAAKLEAVKGELERSEGEVRALRSVAARAAELESEAARLGKDLEESMAEAAAAAAKLNELRPEAEALRRGKAEAESKIEGLKGELAKVEAEKAAAEARIAAGLAEIETLKSEIGELSAQLKNSEASKEIIDELSRELEEMKNKYSETLNDTLNVEARNGEDHNVKSENCTLSGPAIAAATTGAVAVGLVAYFAYSKSKR